MAHSLNVSFAHQKKNSRLMALLTIIPIKYFLLIPHIILLWFLSIASEFLVIVGILLTLFIGKYPKFIAEYLTSMFRWSWRVRAYSICLTDKYPPFSFDSESSFPGDVTFKYQEKRSRWLALFAIIPFKLIFIIPHLLVMMVMGLVVSILSIISLFVVLVMGEYPKWVEKLTVQLYQYGARVGAYYICMTDEYPPISWS